MENKLMEFQNNLKSSTSLMLVFLGLSGFSMAAAIFWNAVKYNFQ